MSTSNDGKFYILNPLLDEITNGNVRGKVVGIQYSPELGLFFLSQRGRGKLFRFNWISSGLSNEPEYVVDIPGGSLSPLLKGDLNGSGKEDLVFVSDDGYLCAYDAETGKSLQGFPATFGNPEYYCTSPVIGDIDDDGRNEVIFTASESLFVFTDEGIRENNFPIYLGDDVLSSPLLADLDGISATLEILIGTADGYLQAYDYRGIRLPQYKIATETNISLAIKDIDNDGEEELLALSYEGVIYVYSMSAFGRVNSSAGWQMWGKDAVHSFTFNPTILPAEPSEAKIIKRFYAYPNPATNRAFFRVELNKAAELSLKVYDIEGRIIYAPAQVMKSTAGIYEFAYDIGELPASVLLGQIEATSANKENKELKMTKLGIVKEE